MESDNDSETMDMPILADLMSPKGLVPSKDAVSLQSKGENLFSVGISKCEFIVINYDLKSWPLYTTTDKD